MAEVVNSLQRIEPVVRGIRGHTCACGEVASCPKLRGPVRGQQLRAGEVAPPTLGTHRANPPRETGSVWAHAGHPRSESREHDGPGTSAGAEDIQGRSSRWEAELPPQGWRCHEQSAVEPVLGGPGRQPKGLHPSRYPSSSRKEAALDRSGEPGTTFVGAESFKAGDSAPTRRWKLHPDQSFAGRRRASSALSVYTRYDRTYEAHEVPRRPYMCCNRSRVRDRRRHCVPTNSQSLLGAPFGPGRLGVSSQSS